MPPRKKPLFRIKVSHRGRALVHLANGKSIDDTVRLLQKRHPGYSFDDVKRVYFPKTGTHSIHKMEGKSREEINDRLSKMRLYNAAQKEMLQESHSDPVFAAAHKKRASKVLKELWKDPEFVNRHKKRARQQMIGLHKKPGFTAAISERMKEKHKDPVFAAEHRARMRKLNKDPMFIKKNLEGVARYWNTYWLKIEEHMEKMQIGIEWQYVGSDKSKKVVTTKKDPEKTYLQKEKVELIKTALNSLSKNERNITDLVFGFSDKPVSIEKASLILGIDVRSAERIFKSALGKLAKNKKLRDLR